MDKILNFSALLHRFVTKLGKMSGWLILPLIFVIVFDVVTRKLDFTRLFFADITMKMGYSVSTIMQDLEWHFHAVILLASFGIGYLANAHVRVDVFRELTQKRYQAKNELFLLIVLALPFLIIILNYTWTMFYISWLRGEGSDSLTGLDWRWAIKFMMPAGIFLVLLAVIATIGRLIVFLFGNKEQSKRAESVIEIFSDNLDDLDAIREEIDKALEKELAQTKGGAK